jgi:hypothetical protein
MGDDERTMALKAARDAFGDAMDMWSRERAPEPTPKPKPPSPPPPPPPSLPPPPPSLPPAETPWKANDDWNCTPTYPEEDYEEPPAEPQQHLDWDTPPLDPLEPSLTFPTALDNSPGAWATSLRQFATTVVVLLCHLLRNYRDAVAPFYDLESEF